MEYIACNQLDNSIIRQLEEHSLLNGYEPFFARSIDGVFHHFHLLVLDGQLIAFIGILPISEVCVEITGYTHLPYRHQGHFSHLLKNVLTELSATSITEILADRMLKFSFLHCTPAHSEYLMKLSRKKFAPSLNMNNVEILEYCNLFESFKEYIYVLESDSIAIGLLKITLDAETTSACLHHVQIRKSMRKKGHGKRLLIGALRMFFEENDCDILLHVTGTNTPAVTLYQNTGFQIIQSLDYFRLHLAEQ